VAAEGDGGGGAGGLGEAGEVRSTVGELAPRWPARSLACADGASDLVTTRRMAFFVAMRKADVDG
jgi:hypothetical protein